MTPRVPSCTVRARLRRVGLCTLVAVALAGCASQRAIDESRRLMDAGQPETAIATLEAAMRQSPNDQELRAAYYRERERAVTKYLLDAERARTARRYDDARNAVARARALDPDHPRARTAEINLDGTIRRAETVAEAERRFAKGDLAGAEQLARGVIAEDAQNTDARQLMRRIEEKAPPREPSVTQALKGPFAKPITMEFRDTPLRSVFEIISRTAGINFVFDKDVKADAKVTVFVRNSSIDDVIRLVLATNQLDRKLLNDNSVLIYPASAAKQKDYQELITRSFFLGNADVKQAEKLVKTVVKTKDTFIDEKLNLLVIKDRPDAIRLAEHLIDTLDIADPEVTLDVEVLEISRSKLTELGLRFPDQISYGILNQPKKTVVDSNGNAITEEGVPTIAQGVINLKNTEAMVPFVTNPAVTLNLKAQDGDSKILANPRIRVKNREKAKIHIGDKLPVFTTTTTANVGVSASVNYLDVGLKLEVEPTVYIDDEVAIKVGLEVSSVVKEVGGPNASLAYQVGTRNTSTVLRLRDGETQVLAGLISDEERSSANRLPGLGHIPGVGRLFSSERDSGQKTEIVLLITPRIVRNVVRPHLSTTRYAAGTETAIGEPPLIIGPTAARTLNVRGATGAASGAPARGGARGTREAAPAATESAEGGASPAGEAAAGAAAPDTQRAVVALTAPATATPGQDVSVQVGVSAPEAIKGGSVTVAYDAALFDGPGGGSATLPLSGGGTQASIELRLKVKAGASGKGEIAVMSAQVALEGRDAAVELGGTAAVTIEK